MSIIIPLQVIDEAIQQLNYRSVTTLKSRLVRAVRGHYNEPPEALETIDPETLIREIWETGDDERLIKDRRKNFSSVKSSVNSDLKKLYADGKNPQGLIIGPSNTFTISSEAKDKALSGIMDVFKERGIDTQSRVTEILTALNDVLATAVDSDAIENTKEEIERLKSLLDGLSGKVGLSVKDLVRPNSSRDTGRAGGQAGAGFASAPAVGDGDLPGYLTDSISLLDQGLQGLTEEVTKRADGLSHTGLKDTVREALNDMINALGDDDQNAAGKAEKILGAVERILADALAEQGDSLPSEQKRELEDIFHQMRKGASGSHEPNTPQVTQAEAAGAKLTDRIESILKDEALSSGDRIGSLMDAVNDLINQTLAEGQTGLSADEISRIQETMATVSANLAAFAEGVLEEEEIIEEIIEDDDNDLSVLTEDTPDEDAQATPPLDAEGTDDADWIVEEILDEADPEPPLEMTGEASDPADELAEAERIEEAFGPDDDWIETLEEGLDEFQSPEEGLPEDTSMDEAATEIIEEIIESDSETLTPDAPEADIIVEGIDADANADDTAIEEILLTEDFPLEPDLEGMTAEDLAGEKGSEAEDLASTAVELATDGDIIDDEVIVFDDEAVTAVDDALVTADKTDVDVLELVEEDQPPEAVEEMFVEVDEPDGNATVTPADATLDDELREKTEVLSQLAKAIGALQSMGPDLGGDEFTEEEVRQKAKRLSEEFDHYLSIRDKYFNQHILIQGGDYLVGGNAEARSVLPQRVVTLPDFFISKFPVTNALFEIFVEQTGYVTTAEKYGFGVVYFPRMQRMKDPISRAERFLLHTQAYSKKVQGACWHRPYGPDSSLHLKRTHPVVQVSLEDARAYAAWTGKRLPSEIEWEAAARLPRGFLFPWGDEWKDNACNVESSLHGDTTPVDAYPAGANEAEVADTLGNVMEWTQDAVGVEDDEAPETYIVKGAGWISHAEISLVDRHYVDKNTTSNILGFRCVAI